MSANWVTVDKFSELTGIKREQALRMCRSGQWQEHLAWRKLSDRIYLISIKWWDNWHETAAALNRRQNRQSKSNSNMTDSDVESESSASPRLPTLES
ncbi:hypothetical protein [Methylomonas sp. HYX-M1]|uniref:hypothetical protein n=1 Tax=Methylomonas sp. HYX-M1 TaxID=3139307 RepID=UPI00345C0BD7